MKQTSLAAQCGISPSYLNLIEHDRRKIGGKLLADLAEGLGVLPDQLLAGGAASDLAALRTAAARAGSEVEVELSRVEEFALRFPGWSGVVKAQAKEIATQDRRIAVMADRARQDPVLAASLHNILSTVTAIRSTAGILAGDDPVEPAWQSRFHRNLYEESQRLASATEALVGELEGGGDADEATDPVEAAERWLGNWAVLSALEPDGTGVNDLARRAETELGSSEAQSILSNLIKVVAADEVALPLTDLRAALTPMPDPLYLAEHFEVRLSRMMRRLTALPELGAGFVMTDAEGEVILRRQIAGLTIPRFGASRALWPLYAALGHPGRAEVHTIGAAHRPSEQFRVWALAEGAGDTLRGMMLILPDLASQDVN